MNRTWLLSSIVLGAFNIASPADAQRLIAVEDGAGSVTFFPQDSLQAAIDLAQVGDVIYLPGGTFTCPGGQCTVDKPVSLIGTGFFPDSTAATGSTLIGSLLRLTDQASGSFFTGIRFGTTVGGVSTPVIRNVRFDRCEFVGSFGYPSSYNISSASSSVTFYSCIFRSGFYMGYSRNTNLSHCIFDNGLNEVYDANIQNCILLTPSIPVIQGCSGCFVESSIFLTNSSLSIIAAGSSAWGHVRNSVFVRASPAFSNTTSTNLTTGVLTTNLFVSNTNNSYEHTDDFHLVPGSPALTAGVGGSECGIYGGASPWKEGGVPFNPHIQEQSVGATTNPQGGLPVLIKVAAQGN